MDKKFSPKSLSLPLFESVPLPTPWKLSPRNTEWLMNLLSAKVMIRNHLKKRKISTLVITMVPFPLNILRTDMMKICSNNCLQCNANKNRVMQIYNRLLWRQERLVQAVETLQQERATPQQLEEIRRLFFR